MSVVIPKGITRNPDLFDFLRNHQCWKTLHIGAPRRRKVPVDESSVREAVKGILIIPFWCTHCLGRCFSKGYSMCYGHREMAKFAVDHRAGNGKSDRDPGGQRPAPDHNRQHDILILITSTGGKQCRAMF